MRLLKRSLAALALAAWVLPAAARAAVPECLTDGATANLRSDAQSALNSSLSLIRRVLHLGPQEEIVSHAISVGSREATLELELSNGRTRSMSLRGGRVYIDGQAVGSYQAGGVLERAWRRLLADGASLDTRALLVALRAWRGPALSGDEASAKTRLDDALKGLGIRAVPARAAAAVRADSVAAQAQNAEGILSLKLQDLAALDTISRQLRALEADGTDIAEAVRNTPVRLGNVTIAAGQRIDGNLVVYRGDADVSGQVTGSVVALFGNVALHRGAVVGRDVVSIGGHVLAPDDATVRGDIKTISQADLSAATVDFGDDSFKAENDGPPRSTLDLVFHDVRNVVAVFIAFAMLGFGTVFFGRRYVEVVADTASHSFGRSFVVGLLGQLLLLPTFAMLIVGLIFTVVGILLLPFAAVAYVIAAILAAVGGYLAVAHAVGETFTRRRMAHGAFVRAPNAYGYLFAGLIGLLGLWAAAALTGWMGPVVFVFRLAAVIVTWLAATTGFGAVLLSRAGLRETFAGRHFGEMSDEYLWATPPATPTAASMNMKR